MQKPSIPKGTRDFTFEEMAKRNYIFDTIRNVFYLYGFKPIETPAMENLSTLMGKYGEEGDKLLFKILNSGDFLGETDPGDWENRRLARLANQICEKGLRYDLTVPFARFVVMHQNEISFPFKRFQIQPVWRADRPQKGRYREFYQCDADIVGSNSLLNEAELIQIIDEVYRRLNIRVCIKLNNRKILNGIAEFIGEPDKIIDITAAIDKWDKIGLENVNKELISKGIKEDAIEKLQPIILLRGSNKEKLIALNKILSFYDTGRKGLEEINILFHKLEQLDLRNEIELDLALARGLNYYTGTILEVKSLDIPIGSITGGGRYDNLTGIFGMPNVSGVGISFGADRIFDVLNQLNLYPADCGRQTQALFLNLGEKEERYALLLLNRLRKKGICAEIYPESVKMKKQLSYADANRIPFVLIAGESEMNENKIAIKNMLTGVQQSVAVDNLFDFFLA
jgi:histidyl-tRNA synthetase